MAYFQIIGNNVQLDLKENIINLEDSYIQITEGDEDTFYSVSNLREDMVAVTNEVRFAFSIGLDQEKTEFTRTVFSLLDVFAQLGGVFEVFNTGLLIFIGIYSQKMYNLSVLQRCYQVEEDIYDDSGKYSIIHLF